MQEYRKNSRKPLRRAVLIILSILASMSVVIAIVIGFFCCRFFVSMFTLPKGELIYTSESPSGEYIVNIYLTNGGATTDYAVRGELVEGSKKKNIYWQYHEDSADVSWIGEYEVNINGVVLDVRHDVYDYRKNDVKATEEELILPWESSSEDSSPVNVN